MLKFGDRVQLANCAYEKGTIQTAFPLDGQILYFVKWDKNDKTSNVGLQEHELVLLAHGTGNEEHWRTKYQIEIAEQQRRIKVLENRLEQIYRIVDEGSEDL